MEQTMNSLYYVRPHHAEWREVTVPRIQGPLEALIRPTAVTACGLDIAVLSGTVGDQQEFPLGHEFIGTVVDIADDVTTLHVGDTVVVAFQISCGTCDRCRRGLTARCRTVPHNSMYGLGPWSGAEWGGALADLVRVPYADHMCAVIDPTTPPAVASLGDNTTDAWRAVGPYIDSTTPPVLAVGHGPITVAAVALARALGSPVTLVTTDPFDAQTAERHGASVDVVESYPRRLERFPITTSGGGSIDALHCALRSTEPGGVCTDTGIIFEPTTEIPLLDIYDTGITFRTGRAHVRADLDNVLALCRNGSFDPTTLIQSTAEWANADEAMSDLHDKLLITRPPQPVR